ncbi:MAG TPA: Virginiamycin B lyase [Candidatus Binatia bacterium]|nr:Virginiamycin B lyase [Candidatus Binatia bacterium]
MRIRWAPAASLALLWGCSSAAGTAVPRAPLAVDAPAAAPDRRGIVRLFDDTYGDAVPAGITAGPDGDVWFTDPGNDVIGRITVRGKYKLQARAGAEVSDGITTGPDGALWFTTQESQPQIGRITTKGAVTLFADSGGEFPHGITTGPDGALWFAESNGRVGRMTTDGQVVHYDVAPSDATLEGIVTGPDGALWVTQNVVGGSRFSNRVIRVTTKGRKKSFTVGSGPDFICVGPDGALWFTEEASAAIGRLTTTGAFTEFKLSDPNAQPSGIAVGPDGAFWFTDFSGVAGIGRMTIAGKSRFYKVPGAGPELDQITAGPDGAMWFTSALGPSAIGRITTR